jgi:maltose alpha-D-glucosyltransferase / alpha-amylase
MAESKNDIHLADDRLWYKDAIIYHLHVKAFHDSNDDGVGDFRGLTSKLDYIQDLGVNTIWLLPFYPSPLRDDGYDIADYRNIHPSYGTRADMRRFVRESHRRGLRVITELVINHTSDQHPWFQAARRAPPGSSKRDFYVWSDSDRRYAGTRIIFTDTETSNWAWDPVAKAYYWHRFFSHQPDLNFDNPHVLKALIRVMRLWLDVGVDGFRLDAIPYLCEREGTNNENLPETHALIKEIRSVVDQHYRNRLLLAEANQWPEDVREYFGDGDECHMAYHFPMMPRMYMAIAQEDRHPLVEIMGQTPSIPSSCQWAIFLRNHDELTLEMVTDEERDYMYQAYASDPRMRINVGIRRRLAPLMDNDPGKMQLMNSLLLSLPGSPIIYYGDEIGMGDNIYLGDRDAVRTPMQWSPDRNAGFSRADPQKLYLPPVMDPLYGFASVNVEAQMRDTGSLLNWMKRIIAVRKRHQAFGRGTLEFLRPGNRKVLAYLREHEGETVLCVANLSRSAQPVELDLSRFRTRIPMELMGRTTFPPIGDLPYLLTLGSYGFYWFRLAAEAEEPSWHVEALPPADLPVLVLFQGWQSVSPDDVAPTRRGMAERVRDRLVVEVLPAFLPTRRWYAAKHETIAHVEITGGGEWPPPDAGVPAPSEPDDDAWLLLWVRAVTTSGRGDTYFVPLAKRWGNTQDEPVRSLLPHALARTRRQAELGIMFDALHDEDFCWAVARAMGHGADDALPGGRLRFWSTSTYSELMTAAADEGGIRTPLAEGSNSAVVLGEHLFLKVYRNLQEGINPEVEMGRFLTERSPFSNIVRLAGAVEFVTDDGTVTTLGVMQEYVSAQGDAWTYLTDYLERFLEDAMLRPAPEQWADVEVSHAANLAMVRQLGLRTGELHAALARRTGDPAFDPEPVTPADTTELQRDIEAEAAETLLRLEQQLAKLPDTLHAQAQALLAARPQLLQRIAALANTDLKGQKIRFHGDYHLGQVLVRENDFAIIDFEGEPARPLVERRRKHTPLKDVAGLLRSLDYAARTALRRLTAERELPDPDALEAFASDWRDRAERAFLEGYEEGARDSDLFGARFDAAQPLLDLLILQKALYELRYELGNRPLWVPVPVSGLLKLLE